MHKDITTFKIACPDRHIDEDTLEICIHNITIFILVSLYLKSITIEYHYHFPRNYQDMQIYYYYIHLI